MNQSRNTSSASCFEQWSACKSPDTNDYIGSELTDQTECTHHATDQLKRKIQISYYSFSIQSRNPQSLNRISCRRNFLHFHPSFCPYKKKFRIGHTPTDSFCYSPSRKNMSTFSSYVNHYILHFLV